LMTDYTLLGQASFSPGTASTDGEGASQPSLAVLPDGTFFMAQWIETWISGVQQGTVRMWHLSESLAVLGTVDVEHAPIPIGDPRNPYSTPLSRAPVTYAVATTGMNVLLLVDLRTDGAHEDYACMVDCSGATPAPGSEVSIPVHPVLDLWADPPQVICDVATDRVIILVTTTVVTYATGGTYGQPDVSYLWQPGVGWAYGTAANRPAVVVFKMSTGTYLSTARVEAAYGDTGIGVAIDPTDSTKVTVTTVFPLRYDFTVSADGTTTTYIGPGPVIATPGAIHLYGGGRWNYPQVAGAPFAPYAGGIGTEDWPVDHNLLYWIENGVDVASLSEGSDGQYTNVPGTRDSLMSGRYALTAQEWGAGTWPNYFGCRLYSWDQASPVAVEILELPYFDVPPFVSGTGPVTVSWLSSGGTMAVDQTSGKIIVATNVVTQLSPTDSFSTLVWAIQGPSNMPNLTGQLLEDRVRFT